MAEPLQPCDILVTPLAGWVQPVLAPPKAPGAMARVTLLVIRARLPESGNHSDSLHPPPAPAGAAGHRRRAGRVDVTLEQVRAERGGLQLLEESSADALLAGRGRIL